MQYIIGDEHFTSKGHTVSIRIIQECQNCYKITWRISGKDTEYYDHCNCSSKENAHRYFNLIKAQAVRFCSQTF